MLARISVYPLAPIGDADGSSRLTAEPGRSVGRTASVNGEDALHSCGGMSRHGAEIGVLALFQRDRKRRCLPWRDQRRLLAVDLEVVQHVAGVLEDKRHLSRRRNRLRRELEEELATLDLDRGWSLARLPIGLCRGKRHQGQSHDCECRECRDGADRELFHFAFLLWI